MNTEHEPSDAPNPIPASDVGRDVVLPTPADVAADPSHAKATEDNAITTATMRSDGPGVASRPTDGGGTIGANDSEGATAGETAPNSLSSGEEKVAGESDGAVLSPAAEHKELT